MRISKDPIIRKNEILDVASKLFAEKGFDHTSTREIIDQAGIARGTLYYHFKSKEEIMDALVERTTAELFAAAKKSLLIRRSLFISALFRRFLLCV